MIEIVISVIGTMLAGCGYRKLKKIEDDIAKLQQPKYKWDSLEELIYGEKPFATAHNYNLVYNIDYKLE